MIFEGVDVEQSLLFPTRGTVRIYYLCVTYSKKRVKIHVISE